MDFFIAGLSRQVRVDAHRRGLVGDLGFQIGPGFWLVCIPVPAFFAGCGDIFVHAVITFHQLGEAHIFKVAVSFWRID